MVERPRPLSVRDQGRNHEMSLGIDLLIILTLLSTPARLHRLCLAPILPARRAGSCSPGRRPGNGEPRIETNTHRLPGLRPGLVEPAFQAGRHGAELTPRARRTRP